MNSIVEKINFQEAELFYKSPYSLVDYASVQSFTLIKSCIELFAYYGADEFSSSDIKEFFTRLQITQKKNGRVFIPSEKKIDGVLECCLDGNKNCLEKCGDNYRIRCWETDGYGYEIRSIKEKIKDLP